MIHQTRPRVVDSSTRDQGTDKIVEMTFNRFMTWKMKKKQSLGKKKKNTMAMRDERIIKWSRSFIPIHYYSTRGKRSSLLIGFCRVFMQNCSVWFNAWNSSSISARGLLSTFYLSISTLTYFTFIFQTFNITKRMTQDLIWWNLFSKWTTEIWSINSKKSRLATSGWSENHFIYDWSLTVNMRSDLIWSEQQRRVWGGVEVERFLSDDSFCCFSQQQVRDFE